MSDKNSAAAIAEALAMLRQANRQFVKAGLHLSAAKAATSPDEFARLLKVADINPDKAHEHMAVAAMFARATPEYREELMSRSVYELIDMAVFMARATQGNPDKESK